MTMTDTAAHSDVTAERLGYGISDADQHIYEPITEIAEYLDPAHRSAIQLVEVNGRTRMLVDGRLHVLIPNPTYDPVARPGSMVDYFRGNNPGGLSLREMVGPQIGLEPSFRYREPRLRALDQQGVDLCIMLPTLALGLEEMLTGYPAGMVAAVRALNRWLADHWGWRVDDRVQVAGVVSLIDPDEARRELDLLLDQGCRVIGMRPGPVDQAGVRRSPADPAYDPFWARAAEAGALIAFHSADTPYGSILEMWGESGRWHGHKVSSLAEVLGIHTERTIYDTMAALICHGLFDRHPGLRVATLELGAGWVPELIRRLGIAYGKAPQNFATDPVESFVEHTWVMPFFEDDVDQLRHHIPIDRIIYGSDWPHPEGLADPQDFVDDLGGLTPTEQRLVMRDNLRHLLGAS